MEVDDNKNLYEIEQEYDGKDDFPQRPIANLQIHDTISSTGKKTLLVLLGVQAFIILILIILLGINGVTLTHLNTVDMCDSTGGLTGSDSTSQIGQILNATRKNSHKLSSITNYTTNDWINTQSQSNALNSLMNATQTLNDQIREVMSKVSNSSAKVDMIQDFADQQVIDTQNISDTLQMVLQKTGDSANKLTSIIGSLSNVESNGITTASVVNDILVIAEELLELQNASSIFNSICPVSCSDIKAVQPNSPSGYYHVNSRTIYCNMDTLCNATGGWTRIDYLDMSDAAQNPYRKNKVAAWLWQPCNKLSGHKVVPTWPHGPPPCKNPGIDTFSTL